MWPAWPPSWWRGGTKNNYRPIYSPARKTWRVTSRFSPVSREAFQAPRGPSLPCHALCAVYLCGRWGHQESLDKLRKVNCGRSAQPPCSAPLANLRAMRVSRACIDADRYHQGPCSRGHWYFTQSNRVKTRDCSFFPFFFFLFSTFFAITFKISPFLFEANPFDAVWKECERFVMCGWYCDWFDPIL